MFLQKVVFIYTVGVLCIYAQIYIKIKQECIPVGCVPSAAVAVCWVGGGVCLGGSVKGGVCPGGGVSARHPL